MLVSGKRARFRLRPPRTNRSLIGLAVIEALLTIVARRMIPYGPRQTINYETGETIMAKNPKTKKTELKDLPASEKKMTKEEMEKLKGGAAGEGIPGVNLGLKKKPYPAGEGNT